MVEDRAQNGTDAEEEKSSRKSRALAAAALLAVGALVTWVLFFGDEYTVTAEFENASQLVGGEQVLIGGTPVGSVKDISLGRDGQAQVEFSVEDGSAPLPEGTVATIRSFSLSGVANRQVQLTLPPAGADGAEIEDGSTIDQSQTVSEVDLDEVFNTLNDRTVKNLKKVIRGFEVSYDGVAKQANRGFRYLNPFLSSSRRLFAELTFDERTFERLIVDSSRLSGALAQRSPDISALIHNLNLMMGAIGRQKASLAEAVAGLPDFMRSFNTTAVNLRATLDDLDPLVEASKPAAERLGPFFAELRAAADDLVPTIRDLDRIIKHKKPDNDLVDLTKLQVPLSEIAIGPVKANGATRRGAFPESVRSLEDGLPQLEFFRAYTPELVGWFNDFGTSGIYDANGGIGRIGTTFNTFIFSQPEASPNLFPFPIPPLAPVAQSVQDQFFSSAGFDTNNLERCPGANERDPGDGSTPFTDNGTLDCDPSQVPVGP
jgi:phospholipid/cholesterol/gamma-HCH transport system substrate-binding protein